jgi:hypothetical protein
MPASIAQQTNGNVQNVGMLMIVYRVYTQGRRRLLERAMLRGTLPKSRVGDEALGTKPVQQTLDAQVISFLGREVGNSDPVHFRRTSSHGACLPVIAVRVQQERR